MTSHLSPYHADGNEQRKLLSRALDGYLDRETREAFDDILRRVTNPQSKIRTLTGPQESWVRRVLAEQAAHPERKPNGGSETPAMLRRENLPMKPPGRK